MALTVNSINGISQCYKSLNLKIGYIDRRLQRGLIFAIFRVQSSNVGESIDSLNSVKTTFRSWNCKFTMHYTHNYGDTNSQYPQTNNIHRQYIPKMADNRSVFRAILA